MNTIDSRRKRDGFPIEFGKILLHVSCAWFSNRSRFSRVRVLFRVNSCSWNNSEGQFGHARWIGHDVSVGEAGRTTVIVVWACPARVILIAPPERSSKVDTPGTARPRLLDIAARRRCYGLRSQCAADCHTER